MLRLCIALVLVIWYYPSGGFNQMQLCKVTMAALGMIVLLAVPATTFGQEGNNLTGHATNLSLGVNDTVVNFTNTGSSWNTIYPIPGGSIQATTGNICVNAYALGSGGGVEWCCSCVLPANGLSGFSVGALTTTSNPTPANLTIKLISTVVGPYTATVTNPITFATTVVTGNSTCDASLINAGYTTTVTPTGGINANVLGNGLIGWSRSQTGVATPGTETLLATGQLGTQEVIKLTQQCAAKGTGRGVCGAAVGSPFSTSGAVCTPLP
jgi:hypothetical protein